MDQPLFRCLMKRAAAARIKGTSMSREKSAGPIMEAGEAHPVSEERMARLTGEKYRFENGQKMGTSMPFVGLASILEIFILADIISPQVESR